MGTVKTKHMPLLNLNCKSATPKLQHLSTTQKHMWTLRVTSPFQTKLPKWRFGCCHDMRNNNGSNMNCKNPERPLTQLPQSRRKTRWRLCCCHATRNNNETRQYKPSGDDFQNISISTNNEPHAQWTAPASCWKTFNRILNSTSNMNEMIPATKQTWLRKWRLLPQEITIPHATVQYSMKFLMLLDREQKRQPRAKTHNIKERLVLWCRCWRFTLHEQTSGCVYRGLLNISNFHLILHNNHFN